MKINEIQLVTNSLSNMKDWDRFQKIMCFVRLWKKEEELYIKYNERK